MVHGLWTDIMLAKVHRKENLCYVKENDFHKMHIAIRPIARAFEKLQERFTKTDDDLIKLKMPLENIKLQKYEGLCNMLQMNIAHISIRKKESLRNQHMIFQKVTASLMYQDASQMKNYQAYYILKINHFWKR